MELRITDLKKEFHQVMAVNGISYTMTPGVYGLLGVNGAGKTTLMRMLCTLLSPTEGRITWDGEDIFQMGERYRKLLGYLPQEFGFYPDFTVQQYLEYIASIKGLRPVTARQRIRELLKQVGMEQMKSRKMKKLSGGMKRRVGIAQALLNDPAILILDEPTAGLDPGERIRFRNLISEMARDRLVLLSTHIVSDVEYIAKEILLMRNGRLESSGTGEELLSGMENRVWSLLISQGQAEWYLREYQVANLKTVSGGVELRVLAKNCLAPGAVLEQPTLEDLFLDCFGERIGDGHDGI